MARALETHERIAERIEAVGWDGLTEPEQNFQAIWSFEAELSNGGLEQVLHNMPPEEIAALPRALDAIGAVKMRSLFGDAVSHISNQQHRRRESEDDADEDPELRRLSSLLSDYPDDLAGLVEAYVAREAASFLGPVNDLELWHARRARGAVTQPTFITEAMKHSTRASDQTMSSRPCPNCGYPSADFRATCRECGYPHGRV